MLADLELFANTAHEVIARVDLTDDCGGPAARGCGTGVAAQLVAFAGAGARGLRRYAETSWRPASQNRTARPRPCSPDPTAFDSVMRSPSVSRTGLPHRIGNSVVVHGDSEGRAQIAGPRAKRGARRCPDEPGHIDTRPRSSTQQHRPATPSVRTRLRAHVNAVTAVRVHPPPGPNITQLRPRTRETMRRGVGHGPSAGPRRLHSTINR